LGTKSRHTPASFLGSYRFFFPFDFFELDGITPATVLTIELAILATTPFLELRFFAPVDFFDLVFDALLVFDFGLVVAAFLAINDSATASSFQITLIRSWVSVDHRQHSLREIL
jgi:hypothetical protein